MKSDWDNRIAEEQKRYKERCRDIETKFSDGLNELEVYCKSPEFLMPFQKASPQLLQLRQVQRNQALSRAFDGAEETKKLADALQEIEEADSKARLSTWIRGEYTRISDRKTRELSQAEDAWNKRREAMQHQCEKEVGRAVLIIRQLEMRKAMSRQSKPNTNDQPPPIITTPRTRRLLVAYRSTKDRSTLCVDGITVRECIAKPRTQSQPFRPRSIRRYRECH
jgi:hypothetical protein